MNETKQQLGQFHTSCGQNGSCPEKFLINFKSSHWPSNVINESESDFSPSLVQRGAIIDQVFLQDRAAEAPHPHRRGRPRRRREVTPGYVASVMTEVLKSNNFPFTYMAFHLVID